MKYTKMHGAGNSFVLVDDMDMALSVSECQRLALELCAAEHTDGMIAITPADDADFGMLFINSDGTIGEMCGNGARCLARYGVEHGLAKDPDNIRFRATAGIIEGRRIDNALYEVQLNDPSVIDLHRSVKVEDIDFDCFYTELGNPGIPHCVVVCTDSAFTDENALRDVCRSLRHSPAFPKGANVSFACPLGGKEVKAITFERGVEDFTLACGTGCGSIACAMILRGIIEGDSVSIRMPGGRLSVKLTVNNETAEHILLTGPTAVVSEGEWPFMP